MRKARLPLEREVMAHVRAAIKLLGLDIRRRNTGAMRNASGRLVRFGEKGDSDYAGVLPGGRAISLETKRPGNRPTPAQLEHLRRINAAGGVGLWIDDGAKAYEILLAIKHGARVDLDEAGNQWLVKEES